MIKRTGHKLARGGAAHDDAAEDARMIAEGVHEHESAMHPGKKKTHLKFKQGGAIEGHGAKHHLGKRARGGPTGKKGGHVTNVIVAPQGGGMRRPHGDAKAPAATTPAVPAKTE